MSLQDEVGAWHRETFGPYGPEISRRIAKKVLEEAAELYVAVGAGGRPEIRRELGDVGVAVSALASTLTMDLESQTRIRLNEVKRRTDDPIERDRARGIDPGLGRRGT